MKLRKVVKNVMALGTGLTMLGATVFGAMAADLGNYPNQYIQDGKFNGLMVVGANAKTEDVLGVVDIATSLQFSSKKAVASEGTTVATLTGDVYQIGSSANVLEIGEALGEVDSVLGKSNLAALASTRLRNGQGATDVNQYLRFSNATTAPKVVYAKDDADKKVSDYLKFQNNVVGFSFDLQFPEGFETKSYATDSGSTTETRAADADVTLQDLEDEDLFILGQTFSITRATALVDATNADYDTTFELMSGAVYDTLKEGETKTYEIGGKSYEVTVTIIADSNPNSNNDAVVKLMVNGQVTKQLEEGDTETLDDGTVVGINDVLSNEGVEENGHDMLSFYIGANKITLYDPDATDGSYTSGNYVEVNEESIEDADVNIKSTWTGTKYKLSYLKYQLAVDPKETGDLYLSANEGLRAALDEPEGMFSDVWDVVYMGLTQPATSVVELTPSGESYALSFENVEGTKYSIDLVDNDEGTTFKLGDQTDDLIFQEADRSIAWNASVNINNSIGEDDVFVVSKASELDDAITSVLTFSGVNTADGILTFEDIETGATYLVMFDACSTTLSVNNTDSAAETNITIGGEEFGVYINASDCDTESSYLLAVDLNGDGNVESADRAAITLKGGSLLEMSITDGAAQNTPKVVGASSIQGHNLTIKHRVLGKYFDDNNGDQYLNFTVYDDGDTEDNVAVTTVSASNDVNFAFDSDKGSQDDKGMTTFGTYVERIDADDSEPDSLKLVVPVEQVAAQVFVTGAKGTSGVAGGKTVTEVQRIQVGRAVLDSEVADVADDNLIVVGGPCANKVSATLLGVSSSQPACYEDFPVDEGQGIIKIVENGEKVAIVVAGYSAADTRAAAQVLANYEEYAANLKGKSEVVVSGKNVMAAMVKTE